MVNDSLTVLSKTRPDPLSCLMKNKFTQEKFLRKDAE